ncbi:hypothetical protein PTTG_28149 [Puccinia triticina 1-1 BBBD Race 1]|uniref:Uncharacterized protein n=1 Tax=Puccinia triticina (isolate 1-1 / race 1 (BBBD)) TaxID=630390 RepID=A0A180GEW0_PUCT1|nr:hypothetical protein PTTG_28149 [Puccinia triticina 1-1 BBBD Race 1]
MKPLCKVSQEDWSWTHHSLAQYHRHQIDLLSQPPTLNKASLPTLNKASLPTLNKASLPTLNKASLPTLNKASLPTLNKASLPTLNKASLPTLNKASLANLNKAILVWIQPLATPRFQLGLTSSSFSPLLPQLLLETLASKEPLFLIPHHTEKSAPMWNEDEDAGIFAQECKDDGKITWYLIIPHGGPFAAAQKKRLDSPETFRQFLMATKGTPEHRQIKVLAYKDLKTARNGGASTSPANPTDGPAQVPQSATSNFELVNQLNNIHGPAEHLPGSHEGNVYINPENPDQHFHLNMGQATSWAKAIRKNPLVTLLVPPKSDQFQYRTKGNEPLPPTLPPPPPLALIPVANPFNFPAMFFNPMKMLTTSMNIPTANAPRTPNQPARAVSLSASY